MYMLKSSKIKNYEYSNLGGVRNSSPAIAGSPFGSANRRIYGFAFGYA